MFEDFKNQLLCKETVDDATAFSTETLIENAACAVGGFFLGKKFPQALKIFGGK